MPRITRELDIYLSGMLIGFLFGWLVAAIVIG